MSFIRPTIIVPFIILSLLFAVWSGWLRIGWNLPAATTGLHHGVFMVNSFLASLIFLERAVTFPQKWVLLLPLVNVLSAPLLITGFTSAAFVLLIAGSVGFAAICLYFLYHHKHFYYAVFLAGSLCLLTGNMLLFSGRLYQDVVYWWMGFFLFIIVAERLELSRFLQLTNWKRALLTVSLFAAMVSLGINELTGDKRALAASFMLMAAWLLKYDMARHSIKKPGQHRYSGLLLLVGFAWLLITGWFLWLYQLVPFAYDAALHSFFIGFVFSMIFSHAPIILPAVAKVPLKIYSPFLYVWFMLLQASLLLRLIADVLGDASIRRVGGGLNGIFILCFFINIGSIIKTEMKRSGHLPSILKLGSL